MLLNTIRDNQLRQGQHGVGFEALADGRGTHISDAVGVEAEGV